MEWTVVRFGWTFSVIPTRLVAQVIFAIGASMIALAVVVHLPRWLIAAFGIAMIAGHNALDGIKAEQFGAAAPIWNLLHQPAMLELTPGFRFFVLYPLVPWIGVMAAGYALGPVFKLDRATRVRWLLGLGAVISAGFVVCARPISTATPPRGPRTTVSSRPRCRSSIAKSIRRRCSTLR
jgi:uncharacterized membrane protein